MLDAATFADLQALSESTMLDTATIERRARPQDTGGAPLADAPTRVTVPCSFWSLGRGTVATDATSARRVPRGEYGCAFPLGTEISHGDSVIISGRTLFVVWVPPASAFDVDRTVGLSEHPPED